MAAKYRVEVQNPVVAPGQMVVGHILAHRRIRPGAIDLSLGCGHLRGAEQTTHSQTTIDLPEGLEPGDTASFALAVPIDAVANFNTPRLRFGWQIHAQNRRRLPSSAVRFDLLVLAPDASVSPNERLTDETERQRDEDRRRTRSQRPSLGRLLSDTILSVLGAVLAAVALSSFDVSPTTIAGLWYLPLVLVLIRGLRQGFRSWRLLRSPVRSVQIRVAKPIATTGSTFDIEVHNGSGSACAIGLICYSWSQTGRRVVSESWQQTTRSIGSVHVAVPIDAPLSYSSPKYAMYWEIRVSHDPSVSTTTPHGIIEPVTVLAAPDYPSPYPESWQEQGIASSYEPPDSSPTANELVGLDQSGEYRG